MPQLTCFIGVMGSGKDYQAKKLIEQGYTQINFTDSLREMAWDILGWKPKNDEGYNCFKNSNIELIHSDPYGGILFHYLTGRQFLQNFGTEAIRKRFPDFWTDLWFMQVCEKFNEVNNVCCSDLRFINELKTAYSFNPELVNIKFIFCNYKSDRYNAIDSHESEKLAQRILADGFQDGDELPVEYIQKLLEG